MFGVLGERLTKERGNQPTVAFNPRFTSSHCCSLLDCPCRCWVRHSFGCMAGAQIGRDMLGMQCTRGFHAQHVDVLCLCSLRPCPANPCKASQLPSSLPVQRGQGPPDCGAHQAALGRRRPPRALGVRLSGCACAGRYQLLL